MPGLPDRELARLRTLLVQHGIHDEHEEILREARPAISLFLSEIVERDARIPGSQYPVGTHRFGGQPDLPTGLAWPVENGEPLSFVLQMALGSLPAIAESPLPATGMLWFFQNSPDAPEGMKARVIWKDCDPSDCARQSAPDGEFPGLEQYEPFGIEALAATDFPPADSHDNRPKPHGDLPEGYFDFVTRARDPQFDRRATTEYPWHWHYVGQLLGVTSKNLTRKRRGHWRRLLSLNENPITDFRTLIDGTPLHYLIDARDEVWTHFDSVIVASDM